MKVNIQKLQQGGGFATFTPIAETIQQPTRTVTTPSAETKKSASILDDDTFRELITKGGLTNDVNELVKGLIKLEEQDEFAYTSESNRSLALKMIGQVNELRNSKENWEKAQSLAKESGGLGEVAVNDFGQIYVKDKDNTIKAISTKDFVKSRTPMKVLTVADLLNERQFNPSLTGRNDIFDVANNSVGTDKIIDHIKTVIKALGTESEEETGIYSKAQMARKLGASIGQVPSSEQMSAVQDLNELLKNPSEYYKESYYKSGQRGHLKEALDFIWKTLDTGKRNKLSAVAALNGEGDPKNFIIDMLMTETSQTVKQDIIPTDISGQPKVTTANITPQEMFHNDALYKQGETYAFNDTHGNTIRAVETAKGPLYDLQKSGHIIGSTIISGILDGQYNSIIDKNKAFVGQSRIDPMQLSELAYTGEDVSKVYMPVDASGAPDLAELEVFNKAYQAFNANKDTWSKDQAERYFERAGFRGIQVQKNLNGTMVIAENGRVKPFLAFPVITNSASTISDNPWMVRQSGDAKAAAEQLMKESFSIVGGTSKKPRLINKMPSKWDSLETPYKGVLFVAYRPEASAILRSMQGHVTQPTATTADIYRNLNLSSASISPGGINASASLLK